MTGTRAEVRVRVRVRVKASRAGRDVGDGYEGRGVARQCEVCAQLAFLVLAAAVVRDEAVCAGPVAKAPWLDEVSWVLRLWVFLADRTGGDVFGVRVRISVKVSVRVGVRIRFRVRVRVKVRLRGRVRVRVYLVQGRKGSAGKDSRRILSRKASCTWQDETGVG